MNDKFTKTQLKESEIYRNYGFVLETALDDNQTYTLAEVDKKIAKYIGKKA